MSDEKNGSGRRIAVPVIVLILSAVLTLSAGAWFFATRFSRSTPMEVDIPPVIYIRDDNLQEMTSFNLDGIQIGQKYTSVFCVAPTYKDAVDHFTLGVIYTENIGMRINIYPVTSITDAPDDGLSVFRTLTDGDTTADCYFHYTEGLSAVVAGEALTSKTTFGGWETDAGATEDKLNRGVYKKYSGFRFTHTSEASGKQTIYEKLGDTASYRFFVLSVDWEERDYTAELEKETDIVYIVSKGTAKEEE